MRKPLLQVENLVTEFRTEHGVVKAVDGVSFDLQEEETLAIVGESGSGKSVMAMSLMRLIPSPPGKIAAGSVSLDGVDLLGLSERDIRKVRGNKIAMIFQEPMSSLNPTLKIGYQVAEPLNLHHGMDWQAAEERAVELLKSVRIPDAEDRARQFPHEFSGGMRQRVMIAMGVACNPRLIIADEPTTALDVTVQAQVLDILKDMTRSSGSALILITHDLGVVARYADKVAVMYAGRIVEMASARDLYRDPQHPYTRGLLQSIPRLDDSSSRLVPIPGQPPNLAALPQGCAFASRCAYKQHRCEQSRPSLTSLPSGHAVACWAVTEGAAANETAEAVNYA